MSLVKLPAEVQKAILLSLDYASLCQIRSTGRYFYNFLTEPEIHDVFLNIDIPRGEFVHKPNDGQICSHCAGYCDATADQEENTKKSLTLAQKDVTNANEKLAAAKNDVTAAQRALRKARSAVKTTEAQKQKNVAEAKEGVKSAKEAVTAVHWDAQSAMSACAFVAYASPDNARECSGCKRKHNGYKAPGLLESNTSTVGATIWATQKACSRAIHHVRSPRPPGLQLDFEKKQKDGKICKTCWKGTRRGASGIQRRRTFIEEFGYWLRETWLLEGKAIKTKAKMLADKSFEDIEKEEEEEEEEEEADAANTLLEIKTAVVNEKN